MSRRCDLRPLIVAVALMLMACGQAPSLGDLPLDPDTGLRLPQIPPVAELPVWEDNPATEEKKRLGHLLFNDPRLSGSGFAICSNCHLATTLFQSSTPTDAPDRVYPELGPPLHRNAPSLLNIVYAPMMRWDGSHFTDLYDMMALPYAEANMNLSGLEPSEGERVDIEGAQRVLKQKLTGEMSGYLELFRHAFGVDLTEASEQQVWRYVGKALAVYIRVAVSRDSQFDAWNAGEDDAISPEAKRGAQLFVGKAGCVHCHSGSLLSDFEFHNVGTSPPDESGRRHDEGRFIVTGNESDRGAFLTPMLRGASKTSPYLHSGAEVSIRTVIRKKLFEAQTMDPLSDPLLQSMQPLSEEELDDLVAFIASLDGTPIALEELAIPTELP